MIIKRILIVIVIVVSIFFTSSCREHQELRDIGIVVATGMDLEGEDILMTFEVIIPVDRVQQSEDSRSIIAQEKGKSVMEAIRNITLSFDRKLFFSHNTVIIFGEELAKAGIGQYIDFFTRDAEPRESAYMVVAKAAKAYEVMGIIVFEPDRELIIFSEVFGTLGKSVTFEIVKSNTDLAIDIVDGKAKLNIEVDTRGLINEDNSGTNTTLLEIKNEVEKACEEQIEEYIRMTMDKAQDLKLDSLGINHIFYSTHPKEFNKISDDWNKEFSSLDYSVDVDVKIIRTGLTNTPANIIKGDEY